MVASAQQHADAVLDIIFAKAEVADVAERCEVAGTEVEGWLNTLLKGAPKLDDFLSWVYEQEFHDFGELLEALEAKEGASEGSPDAWIIRGILGVLLCERPLPVELDPLLAGLPEERKQLGIQAIDALRTSLMDLVETPQAIRIRLYETAALLYYKSGDLVRARQRYVEAVKAAADDDDEAMIRVRAAWTEVLRNQNLDKAELVARNTLNSLGSKSLKKTEKPLEARALHELGAILQIKAERHPDSQIAFDKANEKLDEALKFAESIKDHLRIVHVSNSLGALWENSKRDFTKAEKHYQRALGLLSDSKEIKDGDRDERAQTLFNLGGLHLKIFRSSSDPDPSRLEDARECVSQAIEISTELGNRLAKAMAVHRWGDVSLQTDAFKAAQLYLQCLQDAEDIHDGTLIAGVIRDLGAVLLKCSLKDPQKAIDALRLVSPSDPDKRIIACEAMLAILGLDREEVGGRFKERAQIHQTLAEAYSHYG